LSHSRSFTIIKKMEFKLKRKHWLIAISACLLIFIVKMCETEDIAHIYQKDSEDVQSLEELQNEADSLLTEVIKEIDTQQHKYNKELDSLNNIVLSDNLTSEQVSRLKKKIKETEELLEEAKNKDAKKVVIVERLERVEVEAPKVSPTISIRLDDSVNIIVRDSVVYNYVDTIIYKEVYKIDTTYYNSDEIKKLKLKKN
jgi:predicted transcriptional regulator